MTIEEQLEDLKSQVEATNSKNKELLVELRTAKSKNKELDFDTYNKVLEENDTLKSELAKTKTEFGAKLKDYEKLSQSLTEKEDYLKNLTLENSLNEQLTKIGIKPTSIRATKAMLKADSQIGENGVLIGDKPLDVYLGEWILTDEGKDAIMPSGNSGTNASGGSTPPNNDNKPATIKEMLSGMFKN